MRNVAYSGGVSLDFLVQCLDSSGNIVALDDTVFKSLKSQEEGRLLRFVFEKLSPAYFRFELGQTVDSVWIPAILPWITVTLMDFDCGSNWKNCETVWSSNHSAYEAGENVSVTVDGADTVFKRVITANAENNPNNVVLDEEQQGVSVALYYDSTSSFTLKLSNEAQYPRTILLAGITNIQWPSIWTPSPTPAPDTQSDLCVHVDIWKFALCRVTVSAAQITLESTVLIKVVPSLLRLLPNSR